MLSLQDQEGHQLTPPTTYFFSPRVAISQKADDVRFIEYLDSYGLRYVWLILCILV